MATNTVFGTVSKITGTAMVRTGNQDPVPLQEGDVLLPGQELILADGSSVEFDNGLIIEGPTELALNLDMLPDAAADVAEAALTDITVENVLSILDQGGDLLENLEATAAGLEGDEGGEGHSFIRLARISEEANFSEFGGPGDAGIPGAGPEDQYTPTNLDPQANDDLVNVDEDGSVVFNPKANDTDPNGDTLTITGFTQPANGTLTLNDNGTFTYVPNPGYNGSDSFSYTISDGNGGTDSASVNITVNPLNDAPIANNDLVAENDAISTPEDTPVDLDVLANDTDPDGDSLSIDSVTQPANGTVTINEDGTLKYTPDANFNGEDTFTYTATDGNGGFDSATVTVGVTPVNDPPVASDDVDATDEDTALNVAANGVLANDTDIDGDTLTVTDYDAVSAKGGLVTVNGDGSFSYDPNGQFESLAVGESTTDTFDYTISDGNGGTDTATVTITINGVNDTPDAVDDVGSTDEDTALNVAASGVLSNDTDVDGSDSLTVTNHDAVSSKGGLVTVNGDGSFSYDPNGQFESLAAGESTTDTFDYTISDGNGGTDTATVTITINGVNDAPEFDNDNLFADGSLFAVSEEGLADSNPDTSGSPDTTNATVATGTINASDVDASDVLSFSLSGPTDEFDAPLVFTSGGTNVQWYGDGTGSLTLRDAADTLTVATLTIDADGDYTFTLYKPIDHSDSTTEDQLSFGFTVTVSDGKGGSDTATLSVSIEDDSPVATVQNSVLGIADNNMVTGSLVEFGADGPSTTVPAIQLTGPTLNDEGTDYVVDNDGDFITAGGSRLIYQDDGSGGLIAVKENDNSYTAFTVSVDGSTGSYTVTIVDGIDGATTIIDVPLNGGEESLSQGGNPDEVRAFVDSDNNGAEDSYLNFSATTDGEPSSVNYNNNGAGVAAGASIDPGDLLLIEYRDIATDARIDLSGLEVRLHSFAANQEGSYQLYNDGVAVGETINFSTADLVDGNLIIDPDFTFDAIEFGATGDGNGYAIAGLILIAPVAVEGSDFSVDYDYVATDVDGDELEGSFTTTFSGDGTMAGGDGPDVMQGTSNDESLVGGDGNDILIGGQGDDTLTGGLGVDIFEWNLNDEGTAGDPAVDTVTDFGLGGDETLDLADLLDGENSGNLTDYLYFEKDGSDTVVHIKHDGGLAGDQANADQVITLENVDLVTGFADQSAIIQNLLDNGKLVTD